MSSVLFETITDAHWRTSLRRARAARNEVSVQLRAAIRAQQFTAAGSLAGERSAGDRRAQSEREVVCLTDAQAKAGSGIFPTGGEPRVQS